MVPRRTVQGPGLPVLFVLVAMTTWMLVDARLCSDRVCGRFIDKMTERGIRLALRWQKRFTGLLDELETTVNDIKISVDNEYNADNLLNLTAHANSQAGATKDKIDACFDAIKNLNLTDEGDDLIMFFKNPQEVINVGNAYDASLTASGTFTVPAGRGGLYKVLVRSYQDYEMDFSVVRNGDEVLTEADNEHLYDVKTRVRIVFLDAGDEIYVTGNQPYMWGVWNLRTQVLFKDYMS